jgi:hypothetical protein
MSRDVRISATLACCVIGAFVLFFWANHVAEDVFKNAFPSRFPEKGLLYPAKMLHDLVISDIRTRYTVPILFPLDLAVMLTLSASMAAASWYWLRQSHPRAARFALWFSGLYLASDLIEDCLLTFLLAAGDPDRAVAMIWALKTITAVKLATITAAIAMVLFAFAGWLRRITAA